MNNFGQTNFLGAVSADNAAASPNDLVRLQEHAAQLSGKSNVGHTHTLDDIANEPAKLALRLGNIIIPTPDLSWVLSGVILSGGINLIPGGGLRRTSSGIGVDFTGVAFTGDDITVSQITDFNSGIATAMDTLIADTNTITWQRGVILSANTRINPTGGLSSDASGIRIVFGTAANTAAVGNHGHSQLHNPVQLGSSNSLALTLAGQTLGGEVNLAPTSGLKITSVGMALDFGTSATQPVSYGMVQSILSGLGLGFTIQSSPSVMLYLTNGILSANSVCDPSPPPGFGAVVIGASGLGVVLGSTSQSAAPGNHSHSLATLSASGFMSAADKTLLANLATIIPATSLYPIETNTIKLYFTGGNLSGTAKCDPSPGAGNGIISSGSNGMYFSMGSGANQPAPGNHNHDTLYVKLAGSTMTGILTLSAEPTSDLHAATKHYADNAMRYILSGLGDIPDAAHTANSPPTTSDFNTLVDKVNSILGLLRSIGLP